MSEKKGTKALELWCKRLLKDHPHIKIENMTTSWRNGVAFCALVNYFSPGTIDISTLRPENVYYNNELAFRTAETQLGIPALLDPEDMVENEVPDRLSILTYLSQFYQRLGHTVTSKILMDNDKATPPPSPSQTISDMSIKFGKFNNDKCSICDQIVYLAQRLIVSHKLYHRRCFRCSKCDGQLSPSSCFENSNSTQFCCESCKNEETLSKLLNNDDARMGMLMFNDDTTNTIQKEIPTPERPKPRPRSVLEKISLFENKSVDTKENIQEKISKMSLTNENVKYDSNSIDSGIQHSCSSSFGNISKKVDDNVTVKSDLDLGVTKIEQEIFTNEVNTDIPDSLYKTDVTKFNFLQTQLSTHDVIEDSFGTIKNLDKENSPSCKKSDEKEDLEYVLKMKEDDDCNINVTDDVRLAETNLRLAETNLRLAETNLQLAEPIVKDLSDLNFSKNKEDKNDTIIEKETVKPPRRKKHLHLASQVEKEIASKNLIKNIEYPDNLNPFSEDEDEDEPINSTKVSTNPFGSSDDEESIILSHDDAADISQAKPAAPIKRLIAAPNPFWSDGEEPSSDDDENQSNMTTSTPNLQTTGLRRKIKAKAPPPPMIKLTEAPNSSSYYSTEDLASLSSVSSHCSTITSDTKMHNKLSPRLRKKRPAPTPPDSISTVSTGSRDLYSGVFGTHEKNLESLGNRSLLSECGWRRVKGPAPGLPLPQRREVKPQMQIEELQTQLDLLETQQLGLERQGVLIEQMIRDKCEGDEPSDVPQEEVEDLVIQLCELVNEKNDLFRKQTELMYIRRQQRLEQEQADIEHEIRVIQSRPAVNRIDADKAREEHLVSRLVAIVRMRDELVQQLDYERRRERQEDLAIATSIAQKRAQRNSDSNASSLQSVDIVRTSKKTKVKDKVKKQFKKAKHTLHIKKKEDSEGHSKEKSNEADKKTKWF